MKEQKAALRREIRARIAALPEEYLRESAAGILENVLSLPEFCRAGALSIRDGHAVVDEDKCVLCGYCARVCPQFAVKVI